MLSELISHEADGFKRWKLSQLISTNLFANKFAMNKIIEIYWYEIYLTKLLDRFSRNFEHIWHCFPVKCTKKAVKKKTILKLRKI